jgi:serine/threonine protein phosphatase 1
MSLVAIADIHGHADTLDRLLTQLPLDASDTLVFLGDYVDRGPDSRGVVERVMRLKQERGDRCICLLGNHDDMLLDHWRTTRGPWLTDLSLLGALRAVPVYGPGMWRSVGGNATLTSYCGDIPEEHVAFLASLPLTWECGKYAFVHAGLRPDGPTPRAEMLWGARGFWSHIDPMTGRPLKRPPGISPPARTVVAGHASFEEPQVSPEVIGLDTGCGVGGPLTAVTLPELRFFQVPERS